ncbi:zinc-binding dehydrogenase [Streptomyces sp. NRRL B-1677]|uniref:NADP-dependent oxidoreductase n=1 Tax=Streptomyces klenkii TaxID=1420899 RepID=A0A3B0BQW2_9ACTN|nr:MULTISPECIES: NADP-dependent oxidoreductase [Streptomyces]MBF6046507.1 zinc-binding dehydrogenase [Streptomyces sp. NRRL B-1677]RKN74698.1 NADP-dependent oxidoreductase [Streptomyces klenkii]
MRVITQRSLGGPEVLEVAEAGRPVPGSGEILVRVRATAVNPADWKVRSGHVRWFGDPPFVLGHDFSGVVAEAGGSGGRVRPGDEVFGWAAMPNGANADYVLVPEDAVTAKPAAIDHVHAAALPIAGLTAWQTLVNIAQVRPGQRVLVHGAAGGVGHLAVQVAKARGAHVIGTSRAVNHEFLRGLGADELIDYTATDFTTVRKVNVVIDTISYDYGPRSLTTLAPGGILIDVVGVGVDRTAVKAQAEAAGLRFVEYYLEPTRADLEGLAGLVEQGSLRPVVQEVLPLSDAAKAHELSETGRVRGKVVLVP